MGYKRQKLCNILWDSFEKSRRGCICKIWDLFKKTMGYMGRNCGIYCAKTIGYFLGYIKQKLWDIFGKHYGIYCQKLWDISGKTMGYIGKNMGYIWQNIGYTWQ